MLLSKIGSTLNIFKSQLSEEQLREARQEEQKLAIRADREKREGESIKDAMERLRRL